jgi:hypothetical protein
MNRRCGIKGCIESVTPGAFLVFDRLVPTVRVEVCGTHYGYPPGESMTLERYTLLEDERAYERRLLVG